MLAARSTCSPFCPLVGRYGTPLKVDDRRARREGGLRVAFRRLHRSRQGARCGSPHIAWNAFAELRTARNRKVRGGLLSSHINRRTSPGRGRHATLAPEDVTRERPTARSRTGRRCASRTADRSCRPDPRAARRPGAAGRKSETRAGTAVASESWTDARSRRSRREGEYGPARQRLLHHIAQSGPLWATLAPIADRAPSVSQAERRAGRAQGDPIRPRGSPSRVRVGARDRVGQPAETRSTRVAQHPRVALCT
jgi:hypothetical protein